MGGLLSYPIQNKHLHFRGSWISNARCKSLPVHINNLVDVVQWFMKTLVDILGYEGLYSVSKNGEIYSHTSQKFLKSHLNGRGYLSVGLSKNGKRRTCPVHRLVVVAFIKNKNKHPQVNHKDGVKTNNSVDNLEWCTHSQNMKHSYDNGFHEKARVFARELGKEFGGKFGHEARESNRKLVDNDVLEIRQNWKDKTKTQLQMAKKYGVTVATISLVVNGKRFKHLLRGQFMLPKYGEH